MIYFLSEATAARRRVPLFLVDATDNITPETGESGGQPQLSKNGGAFANTAATLVALANGAYYVELSASELDTPGKITIRYKSANTTERQVTATVVAFDPFTAASAPASAALVWAYATRTLTQAAAQVAATLAGTTITVNRGDRISIALTDLGDVTGATKIWLTVKTVGADDADSAAQLQVEQSAGLLRIAGNAPVSALNGTVTVNDAASGDITFVVAAADSVNLVPGTYEYDVQVLNGGAISTLSMGTFIITRDVTRAAS